MSGQLTILGINHRLDDFNEPLQVTFFIPVFMNLATYSDFPVSDDTCQRGCKKSRQFLQDWATPFVVFGFTLQIQQRILRRQFYAVEIEPASSQFKINPLPRESL